MLPTLLQHVHKKVQKTLSAQSVVKRKSTQFLQMATHGVNGKLQKKHPVKKKVLKNVPAPFVTKLKLKISKL